VFLEEYRNDVDIMCIGVRFRFFHSKRKKRKKKEEKKKKVVGFMT